MISILGSGLMGSEIAIDLLSHKSVDEISVIDKDQGRLNNLRQKAASRTDSNLSKLSFHALDIIKDKEALLKLLKDSELAIGALPHSVAEYGIKMALEANVSYIDLIYSWRLQKEDKKLDNEAKDKGITIIPACGLAPGLSNILAKRASDELGKAVENLTIYVGGIPQLPVYPLEYKIVFSAESVLEEYTREALVIRNGRQVVVPALSELEDVFFSSLPGLRFEAFVTDGLSTLPSTVDARNMTEKTLRWPGHAEKVKFLIALGLLSEKPIHLDNSSNVIPRKLLERLLTDRLSMGKQDRDMTLLRVKATKGDISKIYELVDKYDERTHTTSMARTTGYTCSVVAQLLLEKRIKKKGFLPPEIAINSNLFEVFLQRLEKKGIKVRQLSN